MRIEKTVFISYRRTNVYHARAIYQNLTARGYDVFMDYESIDSGAFERVILREIDARAHFLVVLTPSALERCTDLDDWLRREIERAIEMQRNIVPLMFDTFSFGVAEKYLTGRLALLREYNGLEVPASYFDAAMDRLHTRFLNKPLDLILHPTPLENRAVVTQQQIDITDLPAPTEEQLSAEQYFERAYTCAEKGDYAGAVTDYTEAIRLNPHYAAAYNNRGVARDDLGDLDGAIADYTEALRLNPHYADACYNRGLARYNRGNLDGTIADYTEAIRLNPHDSKAYNNRGFARDDLGDLDGAIADYTEALHLNPQYVLTYNNRGWARFKQGDYDGAIADYETALRLQPDLEVAKHNLERARQAKRDSQNG